MDFDNPAARLFKILENFKFIENSVPVWNGWLIALDAESLAKGEALERIGKFFCLADEAAELVRRYMPDHAEETNHWHSQIQAAFQVSLNGQWDRVKNGIDIHSLNYLKLSAKLLAPYVNVKKISEDDLTRLTTMISDLLDGFDKSNTPDSIRQYCIEHLLKIQRAAQEYRFFGAAPILDEVETMVGHVANEEYRNFLLSPGLGQRVHDALSAASNIVTVALAMPQLSAPIATLLTLAINAAS